MEVKHTEGVVGFGLVGADESRLFSVAHGERVVLPAERILVNIAGVKCTAAKKLGSTPIDSGRRRTPRKPCGAPIILR